MKTIEFIEKVEELGHSVKSSNRGTDLMSVFDRHGLLFDISREKPYTFDTYEGDNEPSMELLEIAFEYASTPIEEREDKPRDILFRLLGRIIPM